MKYSHIHKHFIEIKFEKKIKIKKNEREKLTPIFRFNIFYTFNLNGYIADAHF